MPGNGDDAKTEDMLSEMMHAFMAAQAAGFASMSWAGRHWAEAFGEVGNELAHFIARRIEEDVKAQQEMLHCGSAEELRQVQARFVQTAIDQYVAETGKLVELNQEFLGAVQQGRD